MVEEKKRVTRATIEKQLIEQKKLAFQWNKKYPIGTPVTVHRDNGEELQTETRSTAIIVRNRAFIFVNGITVCCTLDRVKPRS